MSCWLMYLRPAVCFDGTADAGPFDFAKGHLHAWVKVADYDRPSRTPGKIHNLVPKSEQALQTFHAVN